MSYNIKNIYIRGIHYSIKNPELKKNFNDCFVLKYLNFVSIYKIYMNNLLKSNG